MFYGIFLNNKLTYYTDKKYLAVNQYNYCKSFTWLKVELLKIRRKDIHDDCWTL